jgi:hypothetical protein
MKPLRNLLIYGSLMMSPTACPFLEEPAGLAPLATPKVKGQKDYSACRILSVKAQGDGVDELHTFAYNAQGNLAKVVGDYNNTSTIGKTTTAYVETTTKDFTYNAEQRLSSIRESSQNSSLQRTLNFTYTGNLLFSVVANVNGTARSTLEFENGVPTKAYRDANKQNLDAQYEHTNGRISSIKQWAVRGPSLSRELLETSRSTYDAQGNLTKRTNLAYPITRDPVYESGYFELEYDTNKNPNTLLNIPPGLTHAVIPNDDTWLFFAGLPGIQGGTNHLFWHAKNNIKRIKSTGSTWISGFPAPTITYEPGLEVTRQFEYNSRGYPTKIVEVSKSNRTGVNTLENYTRTYTLTYTGCN